MVDDAEGTRARILRAATAEFAEHGIAGARVDRIAHSAQANKALIYHHFGSKEGLFSAVVGRELQQLYDAVPVTPDDVPGWAVGMFDFALAHPEMMRLLAWSGLERRAAVPPEQATGTAGKLAAIAAAQAAGRVQAADTPALLLSLIVAVATAWTAGNPYAAVIDPASAERPTVHREAIRRAVARLCAPEPDGPRQRRRRP